jgi:hypothetical protein
MANAQRNQKQNFWYDLVLRLNLPIDPSSLAILRMLFGICMFLDTLQERGLLFAEKRFGDPLLCTFSCFNLAPLSVNGFYFMLGAMLATSFNIFIGFFYRISTLVFSFCYWYLFLLDKRRWNNHTYLFATLSSIFVILDANIALSLDSLLYYYYRKWFGCARTTNVNIELSQPYHIPSWQVWLLRVIHSMVYSIAGLKKLMDFDWIGGYAMTDLSVKPLFQVLFKPYLFLPILAMYRYLFGGVSPYNHAYSSNHSLHSYYKNVDNLTSTADTNSMHPWYYIELTIEDENLFELCVNHVIHVGGLFLDLFGGWLLMIPSYRHFSMVLIAFFHLTTSQMFNIGMFPWMSLCLLTIWMEPSWPKKLIAKCCCDFGNDVILQHYLNPSCLNSGEKRIESFPAFPTTIAVVTRANNSKKEKQLLNTNIIPTTKKNSRKKREINKPLANTTTSATAEAAAAAAAETTTSATHSSKPSLRHHCTIIFLCLLIAIEWFLPYSHFITKGYNSWTQGLYGYSWDMMIHTWNTQHVRVRVISTNDQNEFFIRPNAFLNSNNLRNFKHPDMLKQYAKCVSNRLNRMGIDGEIELYVDVWRSLNKRYQQRFINPNINLNNDIDAPWSPYQKTPWILPCLFDYDDQRQELDEIAEKYAKEGIEVVFVADFPNMTLEHYVNGTENTNVMLTVMYGQIEIEFENGYVYHAPNNINISLPLDETHIIKTVSATPSRFFYAYEGRDHVHENRMLIKKKLNEFESLVYDWNINIEKVNNMTKYLNNKSEMMWNETMPQVQLINYITSIPPQVNTAIELFMKSFHFYWQGNIGYYFNQDLSKSDRSRSKKGTLDL